MNQDQQGEINSQASLQEWVRQQFQRANAHLAENSILFETVVTEESRYLAPIVAVWKIKDRNNDFYWVICGDVPADYVQASRAKDAREVLRHFSMAWQLKAENILANEKSDQVQKDYANLLISKAEVLYETQSNDEWWNA